MGLYSYDIVISVPRTVAVTAVMASNPDYTVSGVRLTAQPVFSEPALINGVQYLPGDNLISAVGGVVAATTPYTVSSATTADVQVTVIDGSYSTATKSAVFVVPFGLDYDVTKEEHEVGGSPRQYDYSASFIVLTQIFGQVAAVAADDIIAGKIQMTVGIKPRVPVLGPTTYKAISVTQT